MDTRVFNKKGFGAMFITLVIGLSCAGTGYACWSERITVHITASTGNLNISFGAIKSNDPLGTTDPGYDKDVASTLAKANSNRLNVIISNAYPSYQSKVTFRVYNTGTIPVKIKSIEINAPEEISVSITKLEIGEIVYKWRKGELHVHVKQNASQLENYTFDVKIIGEQYNIL